MRIRNKWSTHIHASISRIDKANYVISGKLLYRYVSGVLTPVYVTDPYVPYYPKKGDIFIIYTGVLEQKSKGGDISITHAGKNLTGVRNIFDITNIKTQKRIGHIEEDYAIIITGASKSMCAPKYNTWVFNDNVCDYPTDNLLALVEPDGIISRCNKLL